MAEKRLPNRQNVRWRIAVRHEQKIIYGRTSDVSNAGAGILCETNIFSGSIVTLYIQIPPRQIGEQLQVIEARARVQYSSWSSPLDSWRIGLEFVEVKKPGGDILSKSLRQLSAG